jgi:hypothetical protein
MVRYGQNDSKMIILQGSEGAPHTLVEGSGVSKAPAHSLRTFFNPNDRSYGRPASFSYVLTGRLLILELDYRDGSRARRRQLQLRGKVR